MPKQVTKYSVFVSSPSDLLEERVVVKEVIDSLNKTYGRYSNCVIADLNWDTDSAPGISLSHSQDVINSDIGDDYDIFLGMLWMNYGTPTKKANSGTEEEFNRALERYKKSKHSPQIMFYFKNTPPSSLDKINVESFNLIQQFKNRLKEEGVLFGNFTSVDELQTQLGLHIQQRLDSIRNIENQVGDIVESSDSMYEEDFGILDYSNQFETCIKESTISLYKIAESTINVTNNLNDSTAELNRYSMNPYPNKRSLSLIIKRVARQISDYSDRLKVETPIFYNSFEEGVRAGVNIIYMTNEFRDDNTFDNLIASKESLDKLLVLIPETLTSITNFRDSVSSLPRIQKEINVAKRELVKQINDLIDKLEKSKELVVELSDEVYKQIKFHNNDSK